MRRAIILITLVVCVVLSAWGVSQATLPSAVDLLKKTYAAESFGTHTGKLHTIVCTSNKSVAADVNIEQFGRHTRMEYTSGPSAGMVIIDNGDSVIRLVKPAKTAYISNVQASMANIDLLIKNYKPVLVGSGRIAGRDCRIVRVEPKCAGNPWRKLWIDKTSFVTLKTEEHNCEGKVSMMSEYSQVDYSSHPSSTLFTIPKGWKSVRIASKPESRCLEEARKAVGFTPLKPRYVPAGYVYDGYSATCSMGGVKCAAGLRYTNGLIAISVFECKCCDKDNGQNCGQHDNRMLGHNPNAHIVQTRVGNINISIMGDVSERELQRMAKSFK